MDASIPPIIKQSNARRNSLPFHVDLFFFLMGADTAKRKKPNITNIPPIIFLVFL